ncbi:MAG TPA: HAMP domain-containing sensor histidine kinase, partial [Planctomycetaceae bacterium]|nr:HAMP domain-containing sensor histidine kinase [Planctomycetaceae bacterium]
AVWVSPRTWAGTTSEIHPHVWAAVILGGLATSLPVFLALRFPGAVATRFAVACGQMVMSALFIHLTGGRIETHFHVFGSLAFLAFYRDWRVFVPATILVASDHFIRGAFWPQSVFGTSLASLWRGFEHAGWVLFEDAFLVIACRQSVQEMWDIARQRAQLERTNQVIEARVVERTAALEAGRIQLCDLQKQHLEVARRVGMAEIATGVLHNVGNVLTSVNTSAAVISDRLEQSRSSDLSRAAELLKTHDADLASFLTQDSRGKHVPRFLMELSRQMAADEEQMLTEMALLCRNIDHIKDIIAVQQSYAGISGLHEEVSLADLLEDAIRINSASLTRHKIEIVREIDDLPHILVARQKFLQVVVNLLSNAKYAVMDSDNPDRRITIRLTRRGDDRVRVEIADNGVGIAADNLTRIFAHGFTTRKEGHGFGLHSAANLAGELEGTLMAQSEGPGRGALFILEIPLKVVGGMSCLVETR